MSRKCLKVISSWTKSVKWAKSPGQTPWPGRANGHAWMGPTPQVNAKCDVAMKLSVFGTPTHTHTHKAKPRVEGRNNQLNGFHSVRARICIFNDVKYCFLYRVPIYHSKIQKKTLIVTNKHNQHQYQHILSLTNLQIAILNNSRPTG